MPALREKQNVIQKPFRCPSDLDIRLNRAKGALMLRSGARISDNQFILDLIELGLDVLLKRIEKGTYDDGRSHGSANGLTTGK